MSSQQPQQPQPRPRAILRGHKAQVHAAAFIRNNRRLVTGDAEGYVILWDIAILRPRAVWRAHDNSILGLGEWGRDRLVTHGRDNKLIVWKLSADDEPTLSPIPPLDPSPTDRKQPWMLHMLEVNTMNFCSFASCPADHRLSVSSADDLLIAVPNTLATEAVDIFHLPSQRRKHTLKPETGSKQDGMVMALSLLHKDTVLTLVVGYENGLAAVVREHSLDSWTTVYVATPHTQPILSLDSSRDRTFFLTSGADAILAKHPIPSDVLMSSLDSVPTKIVNTKHAGQQSLSLRDDGRIFATGGWDGMVRVYSTKTMKELAVLKWHKTGCYAVAFASVSRDEAESRESSSTGPKDQIGGSVGGEPAPVDDEHDNDDRQKEDQHSGTLVAVSKTGSQESRRITAIPRLVELSVKEKRERAAIETHWVAAGSKDGKVSLWDIY